MVAASSRDQVATDLAGIAPSLLEHLDAIVDAGPTRYKKLSTLVAVTHERVQVLRPGVIDERLIDRLAEYLIGFICTGNTCRSPLAAALARKLLAERLGVGPDELGAKRVRVVSAGISAAGGAPATPEAIKAAAELGADLSLHASQSATVGLLRRADVIYTMTESHRQEILDRYPEAAAKTSCLDPDGDIEDPIGYDQRVYSQVARHLQVVMSRRLSEIRI
jgi:protein-tyrosine phosphatase